MFCLKDVNDAAGLRPESRIIRQIMNKLNIKIELCLYYSYSSEGLHEACFLLHSYEFKVMFSVTSEFRRDSAHGRS